MTEFSLRKRDSPLQQTALLDLARVFAALASTFAAVSQFRHKAGERLALWTTLDELGVSNEEESMGLLLNVISGCELMHRTAERQCCVCFAMVCLAQSRYPLLHAVSCAWRDGFFVNDTGGAPFTCAHGGRNRELIATLNTQHNDGEEIRSLQTLLEEAQHHNAALDRRLGELEERNRKLRGAEHGRIVLEERVRSLEAQLGRDAGRSGAVASGAEDVSAASQNYERY